MAQPNMLSSMIGPSPDEVRRAQYAQSKSDAASLANADPYAASKYMMGMAGAGFAAPVAGMFGLQNTEQVEAEQNQGLQSQIDHTSPEGLMEGAKKFNAIGNTKMAMSYHGAAQALMAQQSKAKLDAANTAKAWAEANRVPEKKAPATIKTEDKYGREQTMQYDHEAGKYIPIATGMTYAEKQALKAKNGGKGNSITGISELTPEQQKVVRFYATQALKGDHTWRKGLSRGSPLMDAVTYAIPTLGEELNYTPEQVSEAMQTFESMGTSMKAYGPNGKETQRIGGFSTLIDHFDTYLELAERLENGDIQPVNKISNLIKKWTGEEQPTSVAAANKVLVKEINRSFLGGPGAQAERQDFIGLLDDSQSPAQFKETVATIQKMMAGQLTTSRRIYEVTTKKDDFNERLSPRVIELEGLIARDKAQRAQGLSPEVRNSKVDAATTTTKAPANNSVFTPELRAWAIQEKARRGGQ